MAQLKLTRVHGKLADCGHTVNDNRKYLARGPGQEAEQAQTAERGILVTAELPVQKPCYSCYGSDPECSECQGDGQVVTQRKVTFCARCAVARFGIRIHDNE